MWQLQKCVNILHMDIIMVIIQASLHNCWIKVFYLPIYYHLCGSLFDLKWNNILDFCFCLTSIICVWSVVALLVLIIVFCLVIIFLNCYYFCFDCCQLTFFMFLIFVSYFRHLCLECCWQHRQKCWSTAKSRTQGGPFWNIICFYKCR